MLNEAFFFKVLFPILFLHSASCIYSSSKFMMEATSERLLPLDTVRTLGHNLECIQKIFSLEFLYGLFAFDDSLDASVIESYFAPKLQPNSTYRVWEVMRLVGDEDVIKANWKKKFTSERTNTAKYPIDLIAIIVTNPNIVKEFFHFWYRSSFYNKDSKQVIIYLPHFAKTSAYNMTEILNNVNNFDKSISDMFQSAWFTFSYPLIYLNSTDIDCIAYITDNSPEAWNNCRPKGFKKSLFNIKDSFNLTEYQIKSPEWTKAVELAMAPYVIVSMKNRVKHIEGIEIDILRIITRHVNLTIDFIQHNYTSWGFKNTRTYHEMALALYNGEVDFVVGSIRFTPLLPMDFVGSWSYLHAELKFFVPRVGFLPTWINITAVFTPKAWAGHFVGIIIFIGIWYWIKYKGQKKPYQDHFGAIFDGLQITLAKAIIQPKNLSNRILFFTFVIFSFVYSSSFETMLLSFILKPIPGYQLKTYKDLAESDLTISGTPYSRLAFADYKDEKTGVNNTVIKTIYDRWKTVDIGEVTGQMFKDYQSGNGATFYNERCVSYLMKFGNNFVENGVAMVFGLPATVSFYTQILSQKGHPFIDIFNKYLMRFQDFGIMDKVEDFYTKFEDSKQKSKFIPFKMENVLLSFFIWGGGMSISLIVLFIESVMQHRKK